MLLTANAAVSWSTPTHPTRIGGEVVDPVRHRAAELLDQEVMDPDFFRVALGAIFASVVAEIADQFLFLGVDRDHRLPFGQRRGHLGVDVAELRIPVGVAVALRGLAVALQTVTRLVEQVGDQGATDLVTLRFAAPAPGGARSCRSTATATRDHRVSSARPAPRDPGAVSDPWRSFSCAQLPVAEFARTARPAPIPSGPARSCSVQPRSPSRPP